MKSEVKLTIIILWFIIVSCPELRGRAPVVPKIERSSSWVAWIPTNDTDPIPPGTATTKGGNLERVGKPDRILITSPKIVPAHTNIILASPQTMAVAKEPLVVSPGQNDTPIPHKILAQGKKTTCFQPEPVNALPLRIKDAATCNIQYLDVEQGLLSSYVWCVMEDRLGMLWIGSNEGVSRFDGNSFTHYTSAQGLSNNRVRSLLEDSKGHIWIGTDGGGVCRYDGSDFIHYTIAEGLSNNHVWSILEDNQGCIWLGTERGVNRFDGCHFTQFTENEGLSHNTVWSMVEDRQGNIWFGTQGGGVSKYDGHSFSHYSIGEGLSDNRVWSILEDRQGNLWFGTEGGGLNSFDGSNFTIYAYNQEEHIPAIWSMMEDQLGNLWIGTEGNGVICYDGQHFISYNKDEGLSSNRVRSMLEDSHGNLWFGTRGGGVNRFNARGFTHRGAKEGLSDNNVLSMLEDSRGDLWFGTWRGGVNRYDGATYTHITTEDGLNSNIITCLLEDRHKTLWFGTEGGGVSCYDGKSLTNYTEKEGLLNNNVQSMVEDRNGNLWFGIQGGGVTCFNGETFTHHKSPNGFRHTVRCMLLDSRGNVWFGSQGGGVTSYDGSSFTHYTTAQGLSNNLVWCMMEDKQGNLWFGTQGGGVSRFDGHSFSNYRVAQGLSHNWIWSIQEDRDQNVWLSTENGLTVMVPYPFDSALTRDQDAPRYQFFTFGKADGLKRLDYGQGVCLDRKNRIWWASLDGLTMLDLNKFELPDLPPGIRLNTIAISRTFVDFANLVDPVYRQSIGFGKDLFNSTTKPLPFHNYPVTMQLPHRLKHLTFRFSGLDLSAPHSLRYSYFMEGFDDTWSPPSGENKAEYRSLAPGSYTFRVKAMGAAKEWSAPLSYAFSISPPWWLRWWAKMSYFIAASLFIISINHWRTASLTQRQRELEKAVSQRTTEVEERKAEAITQRNRSEELLLNILPAAVAEELKETGHTQPIQYDEVSIMFADFYEFTNIVASIPGKKLVAELDEIFQHFDDIMDSVGLEKIQTVGDAYLAAAGLPQADAEHAIKCVTAGKCMIDYLNTRNKTSAIKWKLRVGIHSGPITAGVVGKKKFSFDVFGDTVNIAARIESSSEANKISVSAYTYDLIKHQFPCIYRGKINAKGKGELDMYFVNG
ncbi:MAG: hypothetical protein HKN76_07925 [Saprospiraceae bacterium]|nr:hypothetical protein [Saprospiraceae bacterium]